MIKNIAITLSVFFVLTLSCLAETTVGTFQEVQFGDYAHLIIIDENGEEQSFWLGNDPKLESLITDPEQYEGRKIKVQWHLVERDIPQAGGPMEIEEVISVQKL
jgi:hypothetical protein